MADKVRRLWRRILRRFWPNDAFLRGMGSVLDIRGTMNSDLYEKYRTPLTPEEAAQADKEALWSD